jgi:hypothetical protein
LPNKDHFIALMQAIDEARKKDSDFSSALSDYLNFHTVVQSHDDFIDSVITFAESLFGCCGRIHEFVYKMDFGRVRPRDGRYYASSSELYDDLIRQNTKP